MPVSCCPIWLLTACNVQPATACREDLEQLPPEADLDAYAAMPVESFGMALLRCGKGHTCSGWCCSVLLATVVE